MLKFLNSLGKRKQSNKKSSAKLHQLKSFTAKHLALEPLERRELLTVLYWDTNGAAPGLGGSGTWNSSAACWSTSSAGNVATQAWIPGSNAVFAGSSSDVINIGSVVNAANVQINTGTLRMSSSGSLNSSVFMTNYGTFDLYGNNATIGGIDATGLITNMSGTGCTLTIAGNNRVDAWYGRITGGLNLTVTTVASPAGGYSLFLCSPQNTYWGMTTVYSTNSSATVINGNGNGQGLSSYSPVNLGAGGSLAMNIQSATIPSLEGSGTVFNWYGDNSTVMLTVNNDANKTFSGTIWDEVSVTKNGSAVWTLSGNNYYKGTTTVNAGTLQAGSSTAFSPTSMLIVNGGTVDLNGQSVSTGGLDGSSLITNYSGAAATLTIAGNNRADAFYGRITGGLNLVLKTVANPTSDYSLFLCSTQNTYWGMTTVYSTNSSVAGAILINGNSHGQGLSSYSPINLGVGGNLAMNITNATIPWLEGTGTVWNWYGDNSTVTLTINNDVAKTFAGTIWDEVAVAKSGSGTWTLSGNNYYKGTTTVNAGTLQAGSSTALPTTSMLIVNGGVVDLNGWNLTVGGLSSNNPSTGVIANNLASTTSTLTVAGDNRADYYYGTLKNYSGASGGTLALTATVKTTNPTAGYTLSLANSGNTYSGATNVSSNGAYNVSLVNWVTNGLSPNSSINVGTHGYLGMNNCNAQIAGLEGTGGTVFNWYSGNATPTLTVNNATDMVFAGTIDDGWDTSLLALAKTGSGKLTLTGANTYSGGTLISQGTLALGDGTTNGSVTGNIVNNANLQFNNGALQTFAGTIRGTGTLTKTGNGELRLTAANTYTGQTTVSSGILELLNTLVSTWVESGGCVLGPGALANIDSALFTQLVAAYSDDSMIDRDEMITVLTTAESGSVVTAAEFSSLSSIANNPYRLQMRGYNSETDPGYVDVLAKNVAIGNPANAYYQGATLGDLAAGDSGAKLDNLVNKWFKGTDHPDNYYYNSSYSPQTYPYQQATGSLFVSGPTLDDMYQGIAGDCYLIATLGSIANINPDNVTNMFVDNGDNTWTVRFYYNDGTSYVADYVTVDRMLPTNSSNQLVFANGGMALSSELWMPLAEKAYVQWTETGRAERGAGDNTNTYLSIDGGNPGIFAQQALGQDAMSDIPVTDTFKTTLIWMVQNGMPVTIGTKATATALVPGHVYVVTNYSSNMFTLRNPWGTNNPSPLTWAQLKANCLAFYVAGNDSSASINTDPYHPSFGAGVDQSAISSPVAASLLPSDTTGALSSTAINKLLSNDKDLSFLDIDLHHSSRKGMARSAAVPLSTIAVDSTSERTDRVFSGESFHKRHASSLLDDLLIDSDIVEAMVAKQS